MAYTLQIMFLNNCKSICSSFQGGKKSAVAETKHEKVEYN